VHVPIAPGEVVRLLAEVPAGGDRIHEIGTIARVAAVEGPSVTLELGGAGRDTVSCPREHVSPAREPRVRARARAGVLLRAAAA
jgi:hypothetical protein